VHQAILIALPQQFYSLVIGNLTGHTVLNAPSAEVAHEEAGFQQMLAVIPRIGNPVWQTA
jgi:hypothetical protein